MGLDLHNYISYMVIKKPNKKMTPFDWLSIMVGLGGNIKKFRFPIFDFVM
jgi:hypothetical protein